MSSSAQQGPIVLPPDLLAKVTEAVATLGPSPPLQAALDAANRPSQRLPPDLLALAQAHPSLAGAVAEALGPRALFISRYVAKKQLPEWVGALTGYVAALSFADPSVDRMLYRLREFGRTGGYPNCDISIPELLTEAERVFNTMARRGTALRVLDISGVPFRYCEEQHKGGLKEALVRALRASSKSLRELRLEGCQLCVDALRVAPLPQLRVLSLRPDQSYYADIIGALAPHSSVQDIRFENSAMFSQNLDSPACTRLCAGVTRLRIRHRWKGSAQDVSALLALFPKVKVLHWDVTPNEDFCQIVCSACPYIEELHFWPWSNLAEWRGSGPADDPERVAGAVEVTERKLRRIVTKTVITSDLANAIARHGMELLYLGVDIGPDNMEPLALVLTRCQKIRRLDLLFKENDAARLTGDFTSHMLRTRGWRSLKKSLECASEALSSFSLQYGSEHGPAEFDEEAMMDALVSIFKALGENARSLDIQIPMYTADYGVLVPRLAVLVDTVAQHNRNLEKLSLSFCMCDVDWGWSNAEEAEGKFAMLKDAIEKLRQGLPRLHNVYLDDVESEADPSREEE